MILQIVVSVSMNKSLQNTDQLKQEQNIKSGIFKTLYVFIFKNIYDQNRSDYRNAV